MQIENASVALMVLTLQFVRPLNREAADLERAPRAQSQRLLPAGREGPRRALHVQPALHQPLLRDEAAEGLQRAGDRAEARGAGERPHPVPSRGEQAAAPTLSDSSTSTSSSSGTTSAASLRSSRAVRRAATALHAARVGNVIFRVRDVLFPVVLLTVAFGTRPRIAGGDMRARSLDGRDRERSSRSPGRRCGCWSSVSSTSHAADRTGRSGRTALVDTGMFAHSRNPLYVANLLLFLGLAIVHNGWAMYLIVAAVLRVGVRLHRAAEEEYLHRTVRRGLRRILPSRAAMDAVAARALQYTARHASSTG